MSNIKQSNVQKKKMAREGGVSVFFAIFIMGIILSIGLGLVIIFLTQIRMIREMGSSVIAFYAADTGIERALYEGGVPPASYSGYFDLDNDGVQTSADPSYSVSVVAPGGNCTAVNYCINSTGIYKTIRRAIEVKR